MTTTRPSAKHAGYDRAAATILGAMIMLIAGLSFVLVEASIRSFPDRLPVASAAAAPSPP
jgi:hypothetical protein